MMWTEEYMMETLFNDEHDARLEFEVMDLVVESLLAWCSRLIL